MLKELKIKLLFDPAIVLLGIYLGGNKITIPKRYLHPYDHFIIIYHSKDIYFSHKKEGYLTICDNRYNAKGNESDRILILYNLTYVESKNNKLIQTENKLVIKIEWWGGGNE